MGLFDKFERRLEQGVNGVFAKAFRSEVQPVEIASALRRAMDDRASSVGKGHRPIVPNLFSIELSSTDYVRLTAHQGALSDELIASAAEHADTQRYRPGGPVTVSFTENDTLETGVFRVRPSIAKQASGAHPPAAERHSYQEPPQQRRAEPEPWQAEPFSEPARHPSPEPQSAPQPTSALNVSPAAPRRVRQRPWLDIDGDRYPLFGAITVIGRDDDVDVILDDPGISRRHSEIRVTNDGPHLIMTLSDLGSTNGTFVNGERINRVRVQEADRITVGRTSMIVHEGGHR
ncbi:FhaA domain-containing protein [Leekyejoonella antrihumi]|uniref:DUF2662 domain-containing protein n=1 Tax=Leekyejoonella antrihumi TaxID=1660198 RepID=A0A563E7E9_9MICO|nr:FhaA domain-containing protein [Leekyejoonella antrihumi]TWP38229.1 DUF2662 domain-containing protein [Leekyejoonella antrihumi]